MTRVVVPVPQLLPGDRIIGRLHAPPNVLASEFEYATPAHRAGAVVGWTIYSHKLGHGAKARQEVPNAERYAPWTVPLDVRIVVERIGR